MLSDHTTQLGTPPTRMFALVIGISQYPEPHALHGAVNDAKAMATYLKTVSASCSLELLLDERATKAGITRALHSFLDNDEIQPGDAIVIYFAGHGYAAARPNCERTMPFLCPHDFECQNPGGTGIPVQVLRQWLGALATKRGDNIVLILDCCYTAGTDMNARVPSSIRCIRDGVNLSPPPVIQLGDDFPPSFDFVLEASHVLLSACRASEHAEERTVAMPGSPTHGCFTSSLIECLECLAAEKSYTTYKALIYMIPAVLPEQHPICIGVHRNRYLWSTIPSTSPDRTLHAIRKTGSEFHISIPHLGDVEIGSVFDVLSENPPTHYGEVVVIDHRSHEDLCVCRAVSDDFDIPQSAVATKLESSGVKLKVFLSDEYVKNLTQEPEFQAAIEECSTEDTADVTLKVAMPVGNPTGILIRRHDPFLRKYAEEQIYFDCLCVDTACAMERLAYFSYYLYLVPEISPGWDVRVKLRRFGRVRPGRTAYAKDECPKYYFDYHRDCVTTLAGVPSKPLQLREATFEYCIYDVYEVEIENFSEVDLYVWAYFFDPEDCAIYGVYEGPESSNDDPPLRSLHHTEDTRVLFAGRLYSAETTPFVLDNHSYTTERTYFLKVFAAVKPADMKGVTRKAFHEKKRPYTVRCILDEGEVTLDEQPRAAVPHFQGPWMSWTYALKVQYP